MAKSAGVLHSTIEISDNILIQESTYSYIDGIDAKRPNEKQAYPNAVGYGLVPQKKAKKSLMVLYGLCVIFILKTAKNISYQNKDG